MLRLCRNFELLNFDFIILSVEEFIHFISAHYSFHIGSSIIHNSTSITTIQNSIIQNSITQNRQKADNSKFKKSKSAEADNSKLKIQNSKLRHSRNNSKLKIQNSKLKISFCYIAIFLYSSVAEEGPPAAHLFAVVEVYGHDGALLVVLRCAEEHLALRAYDH